MSPSRFRPSPALVISMVALFVALGGVGYAAATIGTSDIKDGAVTNRKLADLSVSVAKLKDGAVRSEKIGNGQVRTADLGGGSVQRGKIANGAVDTGKIAEQAVTTGKLGGDSVTAPKLANTTDGVTSENIAANAIVDVTATCPSGDQAISGGYLTPVTGVVQVTRMRRDTDNSWVFTFRNNSGSAQAVEARVTCLVG